MPRTRCPHCGWKDEVEDELIGVEVECPDCEETFLAKRLKKKVKKRVPGKPSQGSGVPTGTQSERPPKLMLALTWLWSYAVLFMISGIVLGIVFANITNVRTGEKAGIVAALFPFILLEMFAVGFVMIANGLRYREPWAHKVACGFMIANLVSPLFIPAIIGLVKLLHEDTIAAFDVSNRVVETE